MPEELQHSSEDTPQEALQRKNPREGMHIQPGYCTYMAGSQCQRCVAVCPHGSIALSREHGPSINRETCTRCGLCRGICDVFLSMRITLEDLAQRVARLQEEFGQVYFTCNEHIFEGFTPAENVVVLPCLAALPPEFWARVLAEGASCHVYLDRSYCQACPVAGAQAEALYTHAMQTAQAWSGAYFLHAEQIPEQAYLVDEYANAAKNDFDRRNILTSFKDQTLDIATGKRRQRGGAAVGDYRERLERMKARNQAAASYDVDLNGAIPSGKLKKLWPRRRVLLKALDEHPEMAERFEVYVATTNHTRCQLAQTCVEACPTGARSVVQHEGETSGKIQVDARLCIACGICCSVCANEACELQQVGANELLNKEEASD